MHNLDSLIATGAKDGIAAVSTINDSKGIFSVILKFDDHQSVVKSVRLRDHNTLASTGNDLNVHINDLRSPLCSLKIETGHKLSVNSVRWHPTDSNILITASFSPEIRVFDIRVPDKCKATLRSHVPKGVQRCSSIYHPLFLGDGSKLLTAGEGSLGLTMYDFNSFTVLSCGEVGFQASALAASKKHPYILAAYGRNIAMLETL